MAVAREVAGIFVFGEDDWSTTVSVTFLADLQAGRLRFSQALPNVGLLPRTLRNEFEGVILKKI
jgi:hypothetical protein